MEDLEMFIKSIDDFDSIHLSPAPNSEKTKILKIYHLCIHLAEYMGGCKTIGLKKYLDIIFFFLCKKNVCGAFLASSNEGHMVTHVYCCLLSPSLYLLKREIDATQPSLKNTDMGKVKISKTINFNIQYDLYPTMEIPKNVEQRLLNLCNLYQVDMFEKYEII